MNVLILTPGRVGSSPLQRVLTTLMLGNDFDKPVINFHDLLHGLEICPNYALDMTVLRQSVPDINEQDLSQSLLEITTLLESVDHHMVGRIAYKGILKRNDSLSDQLEFYKYINDNFFIIRTERQDLFEYALSWGIALESKKLNVHSADEKKETFSKLGSIEITKGKFIKHLDEYKNFIKWSDEHFNINSHFIYEDSINNLEEYVVGLDFMPKNCKTWKDMFGISFNDWNNHHGVADEGIYKQVYDQLEELVKIGHIPTNIPVKLHSFDEKKSLVKNFEDCVYWYDEWIEKQES